MKSRLGSRLNAVGAERGRRPIPPALVKHVWKPGESGNPGGRTIAHSECQRLAREASPKAMMRLIELVDSDDERVALLASEKVLERAWGKPKEQPERKNPLDEMTPEQRRKRFLELFAYAETLQPPKDARIDEAEPVNVAGATPSVTEPVSVADSATELCEHGRPRNEFCQGCAWVS